MLKFFEKSYNLFLNRGEATKNFPFPAYRVCAGLWQNSRWMIMNVWKCLFNLYYLLILGASSKQIERKINIKVQLIKCFPARSIVTIKYMSEKSYEGKLSILWIKRIKFISIFKHLRIVKCYMLRIINHSIYNLLLIFLNF